MTRSEAIKILEYPVKKWSMEWDEREDGLSYYEALDMAISALRQQETVTNRNGLNEPLTLDELRKMDEANEPVYLHIFRSDIDSGWQIIEQITDRKIIFRGSMGIYVPIKELGVSYNLYRQKPEEGTD